MVLSTFTSNAVLKATVIPATNVITSLRLHKTQEEERAKEQEENKPLIDNSNIEEVEEVSEQTKESTGLGASLATSPVEARTRKQEESKPLQQELPKLTKASGGRATARKPVTIQQM